MVSYYHNSSHHEEGEAGRVFSLVYIRSLQLGQSYLVRPWLLKNGGGGWSRNIKTAVNQKRKSLVFKNISMKLGTSIVP